MPVVCCVWKQMCSVFVSFSYLQSTMSDFFFLFFSIAPSWKIDTFRIQNLTIHFDEFFMARKAGENGGKYTTQKLNSVFLRFLPVFKFSWFSRTFLPLFFTQNWVFWRESLFTNTGGVIYVSWSTNSSFSNFKRASHVISKWKSQFQGLLHFSGFSSLIKTCYFQRNGRNLD